MEAMTETSQPGRSVLDFISQVEGWQIGGQTSPAALWVTSTRLKEVTRSQVDDDNNKKF